MLLKQNSQLGEFYVGKKLFRTHNKTDEKFFSQKFPSLHLNVYAIRDFYEYQKKKLSFLIFLGKISESVQEKSL